MAKHDDVKVGDWRKLKCVNYEGPVQVKTVAGTAMTSERMRENGMSGGPFRYTKVKTPEGLSINTRTSCLGRRVSTKRVEQLRRTRFVARVNRYANQLRLAMEEDGELYDEKGRRLLAGAFTTALGLDG